MHIKGKSSGPQQRTIEATGESLILPKIINLMCVYIYKILGVKKHSVKAIVKGWRKGEISYPPPRVDIELVGRRLFLKILMKKR